MNKKVSSADEWRKSKPSGQRSSFLEALRGDPRAREDFIRDMMPTMLEIHCNKLKFFHEKLSNDPHYAIEAFLLCQKKGFHPPVWARDCLAEKFEEYHDTEGTKSLDQIFGFGKSVGKRFKKQEMEERDLAMALEIYRETRVLGLFDDDACDKVARKHNLSEYRVQDIYKRDWRKILEAEDEDVMRIILMDPLPEKD